MFAIEASSPVNNDVKNFGYVMVRPDGFALGLDESIISRIESSNLQIVKRAIHTPTGEQIDNLYPNLHDKHYYPAMKEAMVGQKVLSLIVGGNNSVAKQLLELKGKATDFDGTVRGDFSAAHLLPASMRVRHYEGTLTDDDKETEAWKAVMRDDRMHSDESPAEAMNSIQVMFAEHDIADATSRYPHLAEFLNDH